MANVPCTVALGRVIELYNRVDLNDPSGCELVIAVLATAGLEADSVLRDKATFADLVSGATNEVTNSGYAKKVLAGAALTAIDPDEANDWSQIDFPDQTWVTVAAGDGWSKLVVLYDPVGSQTAADMIPLTLHDFVVTPDGSDIVAQTGANGFFRATAS